MIDGAVRSNTSYTVGQAPLRVQELASANRCKDEFLAMLGHELRNPLASIQSGLHLLSHQTENTPTPKIHAMIERQVCRMTQLLDDLLDVSRITNGRLHVQRERIDGTSTFPAIAWCRC